MNGLNKQASFESIKVIHSPPFFFRRLLSRVSLSLALSLFWRCMPLKTNRWKRTENSISIDLQMSNRCMNETIDMPSMIAGKNSFSTYWEEWRRQMNFKLFTQKISLIFMPSSSSANIHWLVVKSTQHSIVARSDVYSKPFELCFSLAQSGW